MAGNILIYGANGYTGELVAREAVAAGLRPVLAGRNAAQVGGLARELGLECRIFGLEEARAIAEGMAGMQAVLNCAGPFVRTASPLIEACFTTRVSYLDITGEIPQFERLAARSDEAKAAGIMLLPGAGFDVVPSDCLAAHLKARLPSAQRLTLGILSAGGISRGTATTSVENAHQGAKIRRDGRLVTIPVASLTRRIDFGRGPVTAVVLPWGDVATAYYSTGIPNIEVYFGFPPAIRRAVVAGGRLAPLLGLAPVQRLLIALVRSGQPGPDARQRAAGYSLVWGEVTDDAGGRAVACLRTPESYQLTALSCVAILHRVLAGDCPTGYQTPSTAYGADLGFDLPGVALTDSAEPVLL
ncbi:MAG TPA: saccharopine dehydrogenase NADP-binding domain-containing protein [Anaerolineae bacterium]